MTASPFGRERTPCDRDLTSHPCRAPEESRSSLPRPAAPFLPPQRQKQKPRSLRSRRPGRPRLRPACGGPSPALAGARLPGGPAWGDSSPGSRRLLSGPGILTWGLGFWGLAPCRGGGWFFGVWATARPAAGRRALFRRAGLRPARLHEARCAVFALRVTIPVASAPCGRCALRLPTGTAGGCEAGPRPGERTKPSPDRERCAAKRAARASQRTVPHHRAPAPREAARQQARSGRRPHGTVRRSAPIARSIRAGQARPALGETEGTHRRAVCQCSASLRAAQHRLPALTPKTARAKARSASW